MTEARAQRASRGRRGTSARRSTRPGSSPRGTPTGSWPRRARSAPTRWVAYLEPLPDRLRDDEPAALRATATRSRAAYGVKDSIRDVLPEALTEPFLDSIDRLIRELNRARG